MGIQSCVSRYIHMLGTSECSWERTESCTKNTTFKLSFSSATSADVVLESSVTEAASSAVAADVVAVEAFSITVSGCSVVLRGSSVLTSQVS